MTTTVHGIAELKAKVGEHLGYSDYVEITRYLLSHHQGELPEQDVALIALAERLQLARLAELPRKLEESRERKRQQDAAREAWKRDEAAFAGQPEE